MTIQSKLTDLEIQHYLADFTWKQTTYICLNITQLFLDYAPLTRINTFDRKLIEYAYISFDIIKEIDASLQQISFEKGHPFAFRKERIHRTVLWTQQKIDPVLNKIRTLYFKS